CGRTSNACAAAVATAEPQRREPRSRARSARGEPQASIRKPGGTSYLFAIPTNDRVPDPGERAVAREPARRAGDGACRGAGIRGTAAATTALNPGKVRQEPARYRAVHPVEFGDMSAAEALEVERPKSRGREVTGSVADDFAWRVLILL